MTRPSRPVGMPDPGGAAARRRRGRRPSAGQIDSALAAATTGLALYKTGREWWDRLTKPPVYTITVTSDDRLYGDVLADLLRRIPDPDRRSLAAAYQGGSRADDSALALVYSGTITHTIRLDGHPVDVSTALLGKRPGSGGGDAAVADSPDGSDPWWDVLPKKLVITCADIAGRDAATRWLTDLAETRRRRGTRPQMHLLAAWGGWHAVGDVHGRRTDSVALAPGQMDRLVADLGLFLTSRARYDESGIPYHRGYLFEGPPGGGSRPSHPDWFRSLRDQATAAAVPFLFKQWGDWRPVAFEDGRTTKVHVWDEDPGDADAWVARVGKKAAGRALDGVTWDGVPALLGPTP